MRVGVELEGGGGGATFAATPVKLSYGLMGLIAGIQYPRGSRHSSTVASSAASCRASCKATRPSPAPLTRTNRSTTWRYGGGIETAIETYIHGRSYLSIAAGWMRSTWHGVDLLTMTQNPTGGMAYANLTGDTFTHEVGIGI